MLIRGTPKNKSDFILVKDKIINELLQKFGCKPMYEDEYGFYYQKSNFIIKAIHKIRNQEGGVDQSG